MTPKPKSSDEMEKAIQIQEERMLQQLSPEMQERFKEVKGKAKAFSDLVLEKFQEYVVSIALMPPDQKKDEKGNVTGVDQSKINVMVIIDDADSKRFPREDLQTRFTDVVSALGKKIDPSLHPQCVMVSLLWQSCLDGKNELFQSIALALPLYDKGVLAAVKLSEVHKGMVMRKFERYIVSYVLAGSLIRGEATPTSDIDVFVVIDDTDVKKMTRFELKEKLRGIILQMGAEAGDALGIRNKLNIQTYILTEFWDSLREANPIIFTLLRDGIPLFDRGMFLPWKQMLKMGKIRPSQEAISLFMASGQEAIKRTHLKLKELGMEDLYYAMLTPAQSALMLYGVAPTAPKETPNVFREIFVKREKLLEDKYVDMLERVIKVRKDLEHGSKKDISGKEIDELLENAQKYLERIEKLFENIDKKREKDDFVSLYTSALSALREVVKDQSDEPKILLSHLKELVEKNLIPISCMRAYQNLEEAKTSHDKGKLTKESFTKLAKEFRSCEKIIQEYIDRRRSHELQRAKIRVKHGTAFGELILLERSAFVIDDVGKEKPTIQKAMLNKDGSLGRLENSSFEELEKVLVSEKIPEKVFVRAPIFRDLQKAFGKDVEIVL